MIARKRPGLGYIVAFVLAWAFFIWTLKLWGVL